MLGSSRAPRWLWRPLISLAAGVTLLSPALAWAAPFEGRGEATRAELKAGAAPGAVRERALHRARTAALEQALEEVAGAIEPTARKAVLASVEAWTGAYRVLESDVQDDRARVVLEVEVDLDRLRKRVTRVDQPVATTPAYGIARVHADPDCLGRADRLADELAAMGVTSTGNAATPLELTIDCRPLGPVPNTHVQAARVQLRLGSRRSPLVVAEGTGLGVDPGSALADALQHGAEHLGRALVDQRRGLVFLRVESPLPAARVRRLQRALEEAVQGVRRSEVAGIDVDGAVRLRVEGEIDSAILAARLTTLSLPGFSVTIVRAHGPSELTARLQ